MKILFEHDHLYYLPHFEPIIHELKKRGETEIYGSISILVPQMERDLFAKEMGRLNIETISGNYEPQRRRIIKDMDFDLIFVGNKLSLSSIKSKNSFAVMIYHGIGLKKSYYTDLSKDMDLICVESEQRGTHLTKDKFPVKITGFTKLDLLGDNWIQKTSDVEKIRILYAPTFFPSSLQKTIPFLRTLSSYSLDIKLHHFYWTNPRYIKIRKSLESFIQESDNINLVPFDEYNLMNFFPNSGILISDYSSALFEFLPFNRPIVQTTYYSLRYKYKLFPELLAKRLDQNRIDSLDFVEICHEPADLKIEIDKAVSNPDMLSKERKSACSTFLGKIDGCASKRVIDAIIASGIPIGQAS